MRIERSWLWLLAHRCGGCARRMWWTDDDECRDCWVRRRKRESEELMAAMAARRERMRRAAALDTAGVRPPGRFAPYGPRDAQGTASPPPSPGTVQENYPPSLFGREP